MNQRFLFKGPLPHRTQSHFLTYNLVGPVSHGLNSFELLGRILKVLNDNKHLRITVGLLVRRNWRVGKSNAAAYSFTRHEDWAPDEFRRDLDHSEGIELSKVKRKIETIA